MRLYLEFSNCLVSFYEAFFDNIEAILMKSESSCKCHSSLFVAKMATAKNIFGWFDVLWDFVKGIPEGMKLPESWFSCKQRRRRQRAHFLNVQLMKVLGVVVFINGSDDRLSFALLLSAAVLMFWISDN